jgi:ATP-dependent protease ClpP protease subunit
MFEIKNIADAPFTEILIKGDIGQNWFNDEGVEQKGIKFSDVKEQVSLIADKEIMCKIASYGGSFFEALSIYDLFKAHPKPVNTIIEGPTASAGTIVAMGGTKGRRYIKSTAPFLIHQTMTSVEGNADALIEKARNLQSMDGILAALYSKETGRPESEMYALLKLGNWINPVQAKELGFVDTIIESGTILNQIEIDEISNKLNVKPIEPKILNIMTEEEIQALQDENLALKAQVEELTLKLSEIESAKEAEEMAKMETEDDQIIEAACGDGKIKEEMKNHFKNLMKSNRTETRELINALPKLDRRAVEVIKNQADQGQKTPKQLFNERLKANFYKANRAAYVQDFKNAFGKEPLN